MLGAVDVVRVLVSVNCRLVEVAVIMFAGGAVRRLVVCCFVAMFLVFIRFICVSLGSFCCCESLLLFVASSYNTLCSYYVCSDISCPSFAVFCKRRFSQQFIMFLFGHCVNSLIVVLIGPYSC